MASGRFFWCSECNGSGSTSFDTTCVICSGKGTTGCDKCRDGAVPCDSCNATGKKRVLGLFSASCSTCQGKGQLICSTCRGTIKIKCSKCGGSGHTAQSKSCTVCKGKGQVEDSKYRAWINALQGFSVDRLKDEKSRRQYKISDSRFKIGPLQAELRDAWEDWKTCPASSKNCPHGWTPSTNEDKISQLEECISELEEEIDLVQEALDGKLG